MKTRVTPKPHKKILLVDFIADGIGSTIALTLETTRKLIDQLTHGADVITGLVTGKNDPTPR